MLINEYGSSDKETSYMKERPKFGSATEIAEWQTIAIEQEALLNEITRLVGGMPPVAPRALLHNIRAVVAEANAVRQVALVRDHNLRC